MDGVKIEADWIDDLLVVRARAQDGRSLGGAKGVDEGIGRALLSDIIVEDRVEIRSGWFGLGKRVVSHRNRGVGSLLLEWFEWEMKARGILEIRGNLVPEGADKVTWLTDWYERRGYDLRSGQGCSSSVPPGSVGMIVKKIG